MEMREERGGSFEIHQAAVGLGHHLWRWRGQLGYSLCALARVTLLGEGRQDAASLPGAGGGEQSAVKSVPAGWCGWGTWGM